VRTPGTHHDDQSWRFPTGGEGAPPRSGEATSGLHPGVAPNRRSGTDRTHAPRRNAGCAAPRAPGGPGRSNRCNPPLIWDRAGSRVAESGSLGDILTIPGRDGRGRANPRRFMPGMVRSLAERGRKPVLSCGPTDVIERLQRIAELALAILGPVDQAARRVAGARRLHRGRNSATGLVSPHIENRSSAMRRECRTVYTGHLRAPRPPSPWRRMRGQPWPTY
jgi:hypothetical protein